MGEVLLLREIFGAVRGIGERSPSSKRVVFVSHGSKDTWIAHHIAADIERKGRRFGVTTFLDTKDITPGELISESLRKNLRNCWKLVVLLSSCSVKSPWVLMECGACWALRKTVVPVLDKIEPSRMPGALSRYSAIDLNSLEKHLARIVRSK